jgi:hypothetical protein
MSKESDNSLQIRSDTRKDDEIVISNRSKVKPMFVASAQKRKSRVTQGRKDSENWNLLRTSVRNKHFFRKMAIALEHEKLWPSRYDVDMSKVING